MIDETVLHQLKPLWLSQLHREFLAICSTHRVELPVPILQLNDSRLVYGSWQEETGILCLSTHLLRNHSWTAVLQVLKHEMAHQLVAATRADGGPHGLAFQEACERLGVLPEFRRPGVMAGEMVAMLTTAAELSDSGRSCLRRIEKLLALGRSANEHEAALAMEKATALLAKHHLRGLAEGGESRFASVVINQRSTRIATYKKHICSILKEYFYVQVVLGDLYEACCDHHWKTIELFGTRENVAVAEYCYHFLDQRLPLLWAAHPHGRRGVSQRLSYYLGVVRGFRERLAQQGKNVPPVMLRPEARALMVAEEKRLDWYVGLRFPRLRSVSGRRPRVDGALYGAGREVGRQLEMRRGVSEGPGSPACLPENLG